MTRRTQRIAELMHVRNRIDAQLVRLGVTPSAAILPIVHDWRREMPVDVIAPAITLHDAIDTPDQQAARRRVLERDGAPVRKAS